MEVLDGRQISTGGLQTSLRIARSPGHPRNSLHVWIEFFRYMEQGFWQLAIYNDGSQSESLGFVASSTDVNSGCPANCRGNGQCVSSSCRCFHGFVGPDCSPAPCFELCSGNGDYIRGRCVCLDGWKGVECELSATECLDPLCGGHGSCLAGTCVCHAGYTGQVCDHVTCRDAHCSGHGTCVGDICICKAGWTGPLCDEPSPGCVQCSGHGIYLPETGSCTCEPSYTGRDCSLELCAEGCGLHGTCVMGACHCDDGWSGTLCEQRSCAPPCEEHGRCNDGQCECDEGWNGDHCSIEGCPSQCTGRGSCELDNGLWRCGCHVGWRGSSCSIAVEMACEDGKDNDRDGLFDCIDPDCCVQLACKADALCRRSPDPRDVLPLILAPAGQRLATRPVHSFYTKFKFLVGTVHIIPGENPFDSRTAVVVRGKVEVSDGSPLVGVNVSFPDNPQFGFAFTRQDGTFDVLANGGIALRLLFQRAPFPNQLRSLWLPWNRFVVMDTVVLRREENEIPSCDLSGFPRPMPVLLPSSLSTLEGLSASSFPIIPEIQAVHATIALPGSDTWLRYVSSHAPGYGALLHMVLTPSSIPFNLLKVHLVVAVEGQVHRAWFPAAPNLQHTFCWNKTNAYGQPVFGLSQALISVGYEYESCPDMVLWERRIATLLGRQPDGASLGGWSLNEHHVLDTGSGTVHKGSGESMYISQLPPVIVSVMGNGRRRSISCPSCNGVAEGNKLLAPVALACGADGSVYVGDFNFVRRIFPSKNVTSIYELRNKDLRHSINPSHRYYLAIDPLRGSLLVSDAGTRKVYRVRSLTGAAVELISNGDVVAGTGESCLPNDDKRCGDGGPAVNASLTHPRGVAVNKDGHTFFVDGTVIRKIDGNGIVATVIGSGDLLSGRPLSCDSPIDSSQVRLEWPTALAISPLDDSLYILDGNIVLQVTSNWQVRLVAGRLGHCSSSSSIPMPPWQDSLGPSPSTFKAPVSITVSHDGVLYIAETDEKKIHRVWQVFNEGTMTLLAGAVSGCSCNGDVACGCFSGDNGYAKDARLNVPASVTVCPNGVLYIADFGNVRLRAVHPNLPLKNANAQYEVGSVSGQELYVFNADGVHLQTRSLISGDFLYNFSYIWDRHLTAVSASDGRSLQIRRDSAGMPLRLVLADGHVLALTLNSNGALKSISMQGVELVFLTYVGTTGLLATQSDENGWTTFYSYDSSGRLTNTTFPTGTVVDLQAETNGVYRVKTKSSHLNEDLILEANISAADTLYSVFRGGASNKYSLGFDGSLRAFYPDGLRIDLVTEPHVSAGPTTPASVIQNISLPIVREGISMEWRMRVDEDGGEFTIGRKLRVNGRNILSIDYNQQTRTEKIYDDHRKFMMHVTYNSQGLPALWLTANKLKPLNLTYSAQGQLLVAKHGASAQKLQYDGFGRVISHTFPDGRMWTFTYPEKANILRLPSQRRYIFEFDKRDHLVSVIMPTMARHLLGTIRSVGYYRNVYTPPETATLLVEDYTEEGLLLYRAFLGTGRCILFRYGRMFRPTAVMYDGTQVSFTHDEGSGALKLVSLQVGTFSCFIRYRLVGPLFDRQVVRFGEDEMVGARFDYGYDSNLRITNLQSVINEVPLPIDLYRYDEILGKVEQFGKFSVIYYDLDQIITTAVMTLTKYFDTYGRVKEVQYEIYRSLMFWMALQYDIQDRLKMCEIKIGPYSNSTSYTYEYDADGQLQSVSMNSMVTWRYSYDLNGNLHLLNPGSNGRLMPMSYDFRDRLTRLGDVRYVMDDDGFLRQRGDDIFDYNSNGQLLRAYSKSKAWSVWYYYDGLGRRVSRKTDSNQNLQYFYANPLHFDRVTHLYNHSTSEIIALYYDLQGHLFAMELSSGKEFYVAADVSGTPLAVFSHSGIPVKQLQYTAYGEIYSDSNPDFQIPIGFSGGLYDPLTYLVHFQDRDYDVLSGRWTSPDISIWKNIGRYPRPFNLYMFRNNNPVSIIHHSTESLQDTNTWLEMFGIQLSNVIPHFHKRYLESYNPLKQYLVSDAQVNIKSYSWVECMVHKRLNEFARLGSFPPQFLFKRTARAPQQRFVMAGSLLGKGAMMANSHGQIRTAITAIASEDSRKIAIILNNSQCLEHLHYTVKGVDRHYFVKVGSAEWDLGVLGLSNGWKILESGVNITVIRSLGVSSGHGRRYTDITLQAGMLLINVRYGTSVDEERARVLGLAQERAISQAWAKERRLAKDGERSTQHWTDRELQQLVSSGQVPGYEGSYILSVEQFPEFADSPSNIKFLRQTERERS
uniref:EGF-like domain-containing protein n=1 Tax=Eptatretus burgeri TaxID=7764 RepID=A0A8C4NBS7_EPTBU